MIKLFKKCLEFKQNTLRAIQTVTLRFLNNFERGISKNGASTPETEDIGLKSNPRHDFKRDWFIILAIITDLVTLFAIPSIAKSYYFSIILLLMDILTIFTRGAWYENDCHVGFRPIDRPFPWQRLECVLARVMGTLVLIMANVIRLYDSEETAEIIFGTVWHIMMIWVISGTISGIIRTANEINPRWLRDYDGDLGFINIVNILRIAIAITIPYWFLEQEYPPIAYFEIALITIANGWDGESLQENRPSSQLGKILTPASNLIVFYAAFISLLAIPETPIRNIQVWMAAICSGLMFLRGIFVYYWRISTALAYLKNPKTKPLLPGITDRAYSVMTNFYIVSSAGYLMVWYENGRPVYENFDNDYANTLLVCSYIFLTGAAALSMFNVVMDYLRKENRIYDVAGKN